MPPGWWKPAIGGGGGGESNAEPRKRDKDLALYDRVIERVANGENYYEFIAEEHRKADYPVKPGLTVRLPTLAWIAARLGVSGQIAASLALFVAVAWVWARRLREEPGGDRGRGILLPVAFVIAGSALGINRHYLVLHELQAGMLLALSFGLHRPGKWGASLCCAALALAIREHALPFVLLMAVMAFWRRNWKEGAAWSGLTLAFLAVLAVHLDIVAGLALPTDPEGPPWLAMRGLSGWLSNVVLMGSLRFFPHWLAGPLVILTMLGWMGWRSSAGEFGALLYLGYGVAFMLAGRANNFYWGFMLTPALLVGLAFAPMALRSLVRAARLHNHRVMSALAK